MAICRVPYRWLPRTFWRNIHQMWSDIQYGIYNIFRWIPIIWFDADFDYSSLLEILEYKLGRMALHAESDSPVVNWEDQARQLRMCQLLCKRLQEEKHSYSDNAAKAYGYGTRAWAKEWSNVEEQDRKLLGKMIGKHLHKWWD